MWKHKPGRKAFFERYFYPLGHKMFANTVQRRANPCTMFSRVRKKNIRKQNGALISQRAVNCKLQVGEKRAKLNNFKLLDFLACPRSVFRTFLLSLWISNNCNYVADILQKFNTVIITAALLNAAVRNLTWFVISGFVSSSRYVKFCPLLRCGEKYMWY